MGNTKPHRINIGYSRQFIKARAFLERVNMGAISKATDIKENIIKMKLIKNRNSCLIYKEPLKSILVNIRLNIVPVKPKKVFAKTFPKIIVVNFEGLETKFSKVPI
jgi:hypothetical protein